MKLIIIIIIIFSNASKRMTMNIRFQTAVGAVGEPPGLLLLFNPFYTPVTPFVVIMISAACIVPRFVCIRIFIYYIIYTHTTHTYIKI